MVKISLTLLLVLLFHAPVRADSPSGKCNIATVSAEGTATTRGKAKRNSKISLMTKLYKRYPGDANSRIRGTIGYTCKNPLLWRCKAKVKVCITGKKSPHASQ